MANICVFCSSCSNLNLEYQKAAKELGTLIGKNKHNLVYGGSERGLMGIIAKAVQTNGGKVIGVIPKHLMSAASGEDELIKARNMYHRKEIMELKSDAFIALPGGIGTIDEVFDILVARQLKIHNKPLSIININNYFTDLVQQLNKIDREGFNFKIDDTEINLYHLSNTPKEAIEFIQKEL